MRYEVNRKFKEISKRGKPSVVIEGDPITTGPAVAELVIEKLGKIGRSAAVHTEFIRSITRLLKRVTVGGELVALRGETVE